jgi:hypothetical protein
LSVQRERKPRFCFVRQDRSKRYEFVDPDNDMSVMHQINPGMTMHAAVNAAHPMQASGAL